MEDSISEEKETTREICSIGGDDSKVVKRAIDNHGIIQNFIECKVFEFCEFLGVRLVPTVFSHDETYSEIVVEKVSEYTSEIDVTKLLFYPEAFHDYPGELYKLVENWTKLAVLGIMINPYYNYNYGVDKDGNVLITDSGKLLYLLNYEDFKKKLKER